MITCEQAIKNATGKEYKTEEIDEYIVQAERLKQRIYLDDAIADKESAIMEALNDITKEMVEDAKIEKRNALINKKIKLNAMQFIEVNYAGDEGLGVQALLVGDNKVAYGSRMSVDAEQKATMAQYTSGLLADLDKVGLTKLAAKGDIDRDIARYMWGEEVKDPNAKAIGDIYKKYQEMARRDANKAGAWIRKDPNYVTTQSHDIDRIANVSRKEWVDFILPRLDKRTFEGTDDPVAFLEYVYEGLSSGIHLTSSPKTIDEIMKQFTGPANIAKKMSQGRVLHFKNADAWMDYNDMFGTSRIYQSVDASLRKSAETTGLMRIFGTNPDSMMDSIFTDITNKAEDRKIVAKRKRKAERQMKVVNGETRMAGNQTAASYMSAARNWMSLTKLGGALLSSVGADNIAYAAEVRYQGGNLLSGIGESVKGLTKGRRDAEARAIAANLGVAMDSFTGTIANRFNVNEGHTGWTQKAMDHFFRWNGLSWWTDSLKISAAIGMSNRLYQQKDLNFDKVDPRLRRVMKLYGIDQQEWDVIKHGYEVMEDGVGLLTPEGQKEISDELYHSLLESRGIKPSKASIESVRFELERKLRNYISDRQGFAVLEGDSKAQAMLTQGHKRGTLAGELLRSIAQFKQFPVTFMNRVVGREWQGRAKGSYEGLDQWYESPAYGVASLMTALTISGYVSMSAKDIAKGREPREINEDTYLKVLAAAMIQGGGLGIYGDYLFGDMSRHGGGPVETAAGPLVATGGDVIKLWQKAKNGDDPSANAVALAINNTPFMNLFYSRIALDYLFLYDVRETLNPGYMKRMEKRIKKENDQEFLYPPSKHAARPLQELTK